MREQLISQLQQRAGLSQQQAEQAVSVVLDFLKDGNPSELMSLIPGLNLGDLGGMFGGKQQS